MACFVGSEGFVLVPIPGSVFGSRVVAYSPFCDTEAGHPCDYFVIVNYKGGLVSRKVALSTVCDSHAGLLSLLFFEYLFFGHLCFFSEWHLHELLSWLLCQDPPTNHFFREFYNAS